MRDPRVTTAASGPFYGGATPGQVDTHLDVAKLHKKAKLSPVFKGHTKSAEVQESLQPAKMSVARQPTREFVDKIPSMTAYMGEMESCDVESIVSDMFVSDTLRRRGTTTPPSPVEKTRIHQDAQKRAKAHLAIAKQVGGLVAAYKRADELVEFWMAKHARTVMSEEEFKRSEKPVLGKVFRVLAITDERLSPIDVEPRVLEQLSRSLQLRNKVKIPYGKQAREDENDLKVKNGNKGHEFFRQCWTQILDVLSQYSAQHGRSQPASTQPV